MEKVAQLWNELHTAGGKIIVLEYSIGKGRIVVVELIEKVVVSEVVTQVAEDKVEQMEARAITNQVKVILGMVKASLTAYKDSFRKCKALVKQPFLAIDIDLLIVPPPGKLEAPMADDAIDPAIEGSSFRVRDDPIVEA
ncbi:hypothetical protein COCNU_scaffold004568G000010 [Cocos nucifera]|nr:hypothetical protein [Cocos nucifera]